MKIGEQIEWLVSHHRRNVIDSITPLFDITIAVFAGSVLPRIGFIPGRVHAGDDDEVEVTDIISNGLLQKL